ncbi:TetR family transcriptional regulator, partial [Acinetobacter baumannii]
RMLNADASFNDAKLFVYMVEGTIIQQLGNNQVDEKDKLLDYFISKFS